MFNRYYISDFCEEFNYSNCILYVDDSIDLNDLLCKLKNDLVSHLYCFEWVKEDRMFYIENCDLQIISGVITEYFKDGYSLLQLKKDSKGYYILMGEEIK